MKKSVGINYIYNSLFQMLIYFIPLITTPYVARVLGAERIGQYSYAMSIVTYFSLIATMGSSTHGQRVVAYSRQHTEELTQNFWDTFCFRCITTGGALALYIVYLLASGISITALEIVVTLNIINVAVDITWFFQGMEDFKQTVIRGLLVKLASLLGIFLLVKSPDDLWMYGLILLGTTVLGNLSLWKDVFKSVKKPKCIKPFSNIRDIWLLFLPTVATHIYMVLDKSMIGWIAHSDYAIGCYEQSEKIVRAALVLVTSVSAVILPRVANLFSEGKTEELKRYIYLGYRVVFLLSVPAMLGLIAVAPILIPWYLGAGFDLSIVLLAIFSALLVAVAVASVTGLAYLVPTKQQNVYTLSVTLAAGLNLVLNLFLIPRLGAIGAAIATVLAELLGAGVQIGYCVKKKQLDIKDILLPSWKYFFSGIVMFGLLLGLKKLVYDNFAGLVILVAAGCVVYFAMVLLLRDDFVLYQIKKVLRKLQNRNRTSPES